VYRKEDPLFILNNKDETPIYKQLYNQIRERVLSGQLPAGTRIQSVRVLANDLSISRNTVDAAYQELCAEGYIYGKPQSGYFVSAHCLDSITLTQSKNSHKLNCKPETPLVYKYDFHPARLDRKSFPAVIWRKCFNDTLREKLSELSMGSNPKGDLELRKNIMIYLEKSRGVICDPEQIIICAGLQQSLDIVAHLLKRSHSSVAVENPGYHLPRSVFRNHCFELVPIPVGKNGIDVDILKSTESSIAYVTPSHQSPLGFVMPVAHRLRLIEWAESGGKYIIEDDYDSELRYYGKPLPSLQGLRPDGNIIYLGSFSKVLSPALRISYLVLPKQLVSDYNNTFKDYFSTVSLLEQVTLSKFMELGHWERHIRRMRTLNKKKHDTLIRSVENNFGSHAEIKGQGAGLHVVMELPNTKMSEAQLIEHAGRNGIRLIPFSITCVTNEACALRILLGFGGMTTNEIEQGIALLAKCVLTG
jgi:GntR family transcriptional regulator/MocR family aminotransferase